MSPAFDPLVASCADLQRLLEHGEITSVEIVELYLDQITRFDKAGPCINAIIAVAPRHFLLSQAMQLDDERRNGKCRGPLHGLPFILKDTVCSEASLGMPTSGGSWGFAVERVKKSASSVDNLIGAGMILLGKANLSEFGGLKAAKMLPGWSSYGGMTLSPYVGPIDPNDKLLGHSMAGGSSVGSGVAVAAGYSPLAIGADTCGSIIFPAIRAGVYSMKPTLGLVPMDGVLGLSAFFDSLGPMGKSAQDIEDGLLGMIGASNKASTLKATLRESRQAKGWEGLRLGFGDPEKWFLNEDFCEHKEGSKDQMLQAYDDAVNKLKSAGVAVTYPAELPGPRIVQPNESSPIHIIGFWDFAHVEIPKFIENLDNPSIKSLEDLIEFNKKHAKYALPEPFPNQDDLTKALTDEPGAEKIQTLKDELRKTWIAKVDEMFETQNLDIVICPGDSPLSVLSSATGYPIGTVPLSQLRYNKRPIGLCIMGRAGREADLIRFMKNWEALMPARPVPDLLK